MTTYAVPSGTSKVAVQDSPEGRSSLVHTSSCISSELPCKNGCVDSFTILDKQGNKVKPKYTEAEHSFIEIQCSSCFQFHRVPVWCGDRLCVTCAKERQDKYQVYLDKKISGVYERDGEVRFITFTIQNTDTLAQGYADLCLAFKRFKDRAIFKDHIKGGALSIEVTKDKNGWHIHLHLFFEGDYIPTSKHRICINGSWTKEYSIFNGMVFDYKHKPVGFLSDLKKQGLYETEDSYLNHLRTDDKDTLQGQWFSVTGNSSYIVDIRAITDIEGAKKELAKYPFKPADAAHWKLSTKMEFDQFMANKRLFRTFGSWYGEPMVDKHTVCSNCGAVDSFIVPKYDYEFALNRYASYHAPINDHELSDYG